MIWDMKDWPNANRARALQSAHTWEDLLRLLALLWRRATPRARAQSLTWSQRIGERL